MKSLIKHIPNFLTSLNLVCGFISIAYAFQGDYLVAFYFVGGAAFFDFLDGGVARLLKAQSEVGKQLDSLSDMVSFGLAPGVMLYSLMKQALGLDISMGFWSHSLADIFLLLGMVLVPVFSAVRLAKFNIDTRQTDSFIGLPVPANAILITSLGALCVTTSSLWVNNALGMPLVLLLVSIVQSYFLVSPLPMFALKFKSLAWKDNWLQYVFLTISAILILSMGISGITLTIVFYLTISLVVRLLGR